MTWTIALKPLSRFELRRVVGVACLAAAAIDAGDKDWTQWRGPKRDGKSAAVGLLQDWGDKKPTLEWSADNLGVGYSSPSVAGKKLFLLGVKDSQESLICLNAADGAAVWSSPISNVLKNEWGDGPRSSPVIEGERIYVFTGVGVLACLEVETGKIVWKIDVTKQFQGKVPFWGYSESPLIDGENILVSPGGDKHVVCINKSTAKTVWVSGGLSGEAQYASLMPGEIDGLRYFVGMSKSGAHAVSAADGKLLWSYRKSGNNIAVIPTPIVDGEHVYTCSDYGTGGGLVKLSKNGDKVEAAEVYFNKLMQNHHGGVIMHDGHLYGCSGNRNREIAWRCLDFKTGEQKWEHQKFEKGSISFADGRFYCYGEQSGKCLLIDASPSGWRELGLLELPKKTSVGRKRGAIWAHPVIADGKLYLRDLDLLFCFNVAK